MKRIVLTDYIDYEFILIGICTQLNDYKLCWYLNKQLELDFIRDENDISSLHQKKKVDIFFSLFNHIDVENDLHYALISNKSFSVNLIPEHKQTDYFLKITGEINLIDQLEIVKKIKQIEQVITAFSIEISSLKSKDNIIF
jgi:UPF0288 family protein (methanogenesis marker protein 3)